MDLPEFLGVEPVYQIADWGADECVGLGGGDQSVFLVGLKK